MSGQNFKQVTISDTEAIPNYNQFTNTPLFNRKNIVFFVEPKKTEFSVD